METSRARVGRRGFLALLLLYVGLRLVLATLPGYAADLDWYRRWALAAASQGLPAVYESTDVDYPPVLLYPLHVAGTIYLAVHPEGTLASARESTLFTVLIGSLGLILVIKFGVGGIWVARDRFWPGVYDKFAASTRDISNDTA